MKNVLAHTKYDSSVDWGDVRETFSKAVGKRIWFERDGNKVTLFTEGVPEKVMEILIKKAAEIAVEEAMFQAAIWELSDMVKWERNARLN